MTRYLAVLLFAFSAVALGSTGNISKVNSSITVEAGQQAGDVSTVNGSITIQEDGRVRDVETVNGSIKIYARAQAEDVETVNGSVLVAEEAMEPSLPELEPDLIDGDRARRIRFRLAPGVLACCLRAEHAPKREYDDSE